MKKPATKGNFVRRKTDFLWMLVILGVMIYAGEYFFPERSTPEDLVAFRNLYDVFNLEEKYGAPAKWIAWWFITMVSMNSITWAMFYYFMKADPENTSMKHFWDQAKVILINFAQLPLLQIVWDMLEQNGYTKATMGNLDPISIVRDCLLWMLCFEWAWYFQHRGMHDNKFLWKLGHSYHHGWNSPEHMIGITNFAFDHIVEFWVTMSSSFLGYLLFPSNFFVGKAISLGYMILAVLAHWEGFDMSRYHINHHYLVTKNYGSHVPIFDMLFGTYQWEPYVHSESNRAKKMIKRTD